MPLELSSRGRTLLGALAGCLSRQPGSEDPDGLARVRARSDSVFGHRRALDAHPLHGGSEIPRVSIKELVDHPELASRFTGKTVFVGDTSSTSGDRKMTPLGEMPGVEIHAQAFETIAHGAFLNEANWMALAFAALLVVAAGA